MKLGILFSGGKDSTLALAKAREKEDVVCLISILSRNKESYMFHTPNINLTKIQAEAIGLPIVQQYSDGIEDNELADLRIAIDNAKSMYQIEGVVTGAVESVYQASRIQKICDDLGLWCFNPLWKMAQTELLQEIIKRKFEVVVSGVFAYPLDKSWLGRRYDEDLIEQLTDVEKKFHISISGEGGETESTVMHAPFFNKKVVIKNAEILWDRDSGIYRINEVILE